MVMKYLAVTVRVSELLRPNIVQMKLYNSEAEG